VAWDGARLLISEGDRFYRVNPSGTIAGSFPFPADSGGGLSFDGTDIWLAASADRTVYKLTSKGAVEDEFRLPLNFSGAGLALDGEHLMIGAAGVPSAYRFDVSGNILGAISLPAPPTGIASDGETMWIASDHADAIFQIDPSGRVLDFFPSPGPRPFGLTFDGANLWCGDISTGKVYQLPLAFMPGDVSGDNLLDLADAVVALKTLCGFQAEDSGEANDINGDGKIGLAEAIYSLQKIASP
jgi:sugar lactone lactonase YvrE